MRRRWLDVVLAAYMAVVAFGVFGPSPGEALDQAGQGARHIDAEVRSVVPGGPSGSRSTAASTRDLVRGLDAEDVGNIVMFMPFGVLFPTRWPRWRRWTIAAGVALSAGIELTQLLFLSWRSPSLTRPPERAHRPTSRPSYPALPAEVGHGDGVRRLARCAQDGRLHGMRTTIDGAGRLVVPKKLRDRLALGHGGVVDVIERDGVLEIHPLSASVEVRSSAGGPVAHALEALPPLTDNDVRGTLEHLRG